MESEKSSQFSIEESTPNIGSPEVFNEGYFDVSLNRTELVKFLARVLPDGFDLNNLTIGFSAGTHNDSSEDGHISGGRIFMDGDRYVIEVFSTIQTSDDDIELIQIPVSKEGIARALGHEFSHLAAVIQNNDELDSSSLDSHEDWKNDEREITAEEFADDNYEGLSSMLDVDYSLVEANLSEEESSEINEHFGNSKYLMPDRAFKVYETDAPSIYWTEDAKRLIIESGKAKDDIEFRRVIHRVYALIDQGKALVRMRRLKRSVLRRVIGEITITLAANSERFMK